jgi:effector-binding domain-containing protein
MSQKPLVLRYLVAWAKHHGYTIVGPIRERYRRVVEGNPYHPFNVMDVYLPIVEGSP